LIGAPAHRAIAREAVRKSLVLLKNDGVLPIRANARVMVTGTAADDIGAQSGGWTITWQATDTKNKGLSERESVLAGIKAAIRDGGGVLVDTIDSEGVAKTGTSPSSCTARKPYAEMQATARLDSITRGMRSTTSATCGASESPWCPSSCGTAAVGQPGNQREQCLRRRVVAGYRGRGNRRQC